MQVRLRAFYLMHGVTQIFRRWWGISIFFWSGCVVLAAGFPGIYTGWGNTNLVTTNSALAVGTITQISAGGFHALALREDQTVVAWGDNTYAQTNLPPTLTNIIAISAGAQHSLALRSDGTVVAWGGNVFAQTNVPAGLNGVLAVAAGADHSVALRSNGTVVAWGRSSVLTNVPASATNIVAIAACSTATFAIRSNGTVLAWGQNTYSLTNLPSSLTNVASISVGLEHALALRSNGTVIAWGGANTYGQATVPSTLTNAVGISAGWLHSMAMRSDGKLLAWGLATSGQATVPETLTNVGGFSAGNGFSLAIDLAPRFVSKPPAVVTLSPSQTNALGVAVLSGGTPTIQWFFNGAMLANETNLGLFITDFSMTKAGVYSVTVSNQFNSANTSTIVRMTNSPTVTINGVLIGGGGVTRTNSATIVLSATTNMYPRLYYTLDGSEPDFTSPQYSSPIVTSNSATVRAIAYNNLVTDNYEAATVALKVIPTYPLNVSNGGGSVAISPSPDLNANNYLSNTLVTLNASAGIGWSFTHWTGAVNSADSTINVTMDQARTLQAVFVTTLNFFTNGNGYIITEPPSGPFPYGSTVMLTGVAGAPSYFFGWAGYLSGFVNPLKIVVTNATGITALFGNLSGNQVKLVALPVGGGSLSVNPTKNVYTNGEVVAVSAISTSNRIFSIWSGAASGSENPILITLNGNTFLNGNFVPGVSTNTPVFVLLPPPRVMSPGDTTLLSVRATGLGPLLYQWRLNGNPVSGATSTNLLLTNVTAEKAGFYDVVVSGGLGTSVGPPTLVALFGLDFAASIELTYPLLTIDCAAGAQFTIEYKDGLHPTNMWNYLGPVSMSASRGYFIDNSHTNPPQRFYRLVPD